LVTYTNLNPGTYVFRVTGSNDSGAWNEAGRAITLIVTPPWWATWWFRILAFTLIAGIGATLYLWWASSIQAQHRRLEMQVASRTRELSQSNARLIEQIGEREHAEAELKRMNEERATLLSASQQLAEASGDDPLPDRILDLLAQVVDFTAAAVGTLNDDIVEIQASRGFARDLRGRLIESESNSLTSALIATRAPIGVPNVQSHPTLLALTEAVTSAPVIGYSWLGVPLVAHDQVIGILSILHSEVDHFSPDDQQRVQIFANLAAVAIENARLGQLAMAAAVLEERSRIARDLHDAVSQTLFSASLIAEGLRDTRNRSPARERQGLEELRQLTRGALAEMRALLLELHPGGLAERPLGNLLDSLCTAFTSRTQIPVALAVTGTDKLEPEVQEMLYRIAQEALNNIGKHAGAGAARVALTCSPEEVVLVIADDGRGFDTATQAHGSLGLEIMRERAAKIGAELRMESELGVGTTITAIWRALDRHDAAVSDSAQ
jgi:signal transduction histidine kinase